MVKVNDIIDLLDESLTVIILEDGGLFNPDKSLAVYNPGTYDGFYDSSIVISITPANNALSIVIEK